MRPYPRVLLDDQDRNFDVAGILKTVKEHHQDIMSTILALGQRIDDHRQHQTSSTGYDPYGHPFDLPTHDVVYIQPRTSEWIVSVGSFDEARSYGRAATLPEALESLRTNLTLFVDDLPWPPP